MIGATTSQSLDLTLINKGDIVYGTSTIKVEIGLKIGSTVEYIPIGIYNIDDIEKTDYTIKITAFDNMMKFERNFSTTLGDTLTLQQVVSELNRITGVEFTGSLPSYTVKKLEGFSCREVLGYVASLCGGNAVINRDGKFIIVTPKDINYPIGTSNYFIGDYKREETKYKIGKISCQAGEEVLTKGTLGADSMELEFENPWVTTAILNDIYTKLNGFEYLGYSMKWQGDLSLDVGDIVTITDKKGVVRKHPILSQKFTYTGGLTSEISAKGENKNKNEFSGSGPYAKKVERVVMELALINKALIDVAYIGDLTAGNIKFDTASGTIMDLQTLLAKFVTGENGQFLNLTTDNVTISNALIKEVIAKSISVEDLKASTISTNKFRITSDNGGIEIVGATQQFKDKNNKVRIQMGQDTQGNFNFILRGEDGTTTLIDHTGIKEKAIADKLIKANMVADNAIGEQQINYSSLVTGLNKDTNTSLIQASKVAIDLTGQSLDVAFNSLESSVKGFDERIEANTTSISVVQGKIEGLIKESAITKSDVTTLKDNYTSIKATVDGINTTVASHTSFIGALNSNVSTIQGSITQLNNQITQKVEATEVNTIVNNAVNNIQIGGRNLALGTSSEYSTPFTNFDGGVNRTITLGKVLTDGLSIGDTMSVKLVYKYDNVVPTTGKTATCWIQGYGTSTGWGPGFFEPSPRFNPTGSGEYEFIYRITINEEHLKNKFWMTSIRHDNILSGSVQWKMFKVENGNKSTDWSQASEDVDQAIATVDTKIETTNNKVATIETNLSSITQRVSSTESTVNTINGNVTNLTSRVSTAESKLTAVSLTTTISSAINAGTSSITTTQFVMDKTGFTVKNGAIKIQNKAGTNVMTSDTNGNLTITGTFVNKNYNGVDAIKIQDTSIYFYDWERNGRELGLIYSSQLSDYPNVRGFSLAHNNEGYMTLGYKTSTGYNSYIVLDKYAKNPAYPAPIRVLESAVFQSAVNMQERVYVPNKICFESTYNARTPQIFKNTSDSRNILISQVSVNAVNDGYMIQSNTGGVLFSILAGSSYPAYFNTNVQINGSYTATGSKNSLQSTEHYGERLINAFETAEYYYSDIGFGKISDSGECYISIDDILQECVNLDCEYHIFTQQYNGKITTIDRKREYFVVYGEPGTEFSWQYIAKRIGYENVRLDQPDIDGYLDNTSIFTEEDLKVDTSEDTLMEELDFNLEEVLMEVI